MLLSESLDYQHVFTCVCETCGSTGVFVGDNPNEDPKYCPCCGTYELEFQKCADVYEALEDFATLANAVR